MSGEVVVAFGLSDTCEFLEAEGCGYVIRLPANIVLQRNMPASWSAWPAGLLGGGGIRAL